MIGEDNGLVCSEKCVECPITQSVWVFALRLQLHQVDDVNHTDFQFWKVDPQQIHRSHDFQRRHIATARHNDIWLTTFVAARPWPRRNARAAVFDRGVHVEPLR